MATAAIGSAAKSQSRGVSSAVVTQSEEDSRPAYKIIAEQISQKFGFNKKSSASEICDAVNRAINARQCFKAKERFFLIRLELGRGVDAGRIAMHIAQRGATGTSKPMFHSADLFRAKPAKK